MALVVSPVRAAAILLPVLCVMDLVALWKYRGRWVWSELKILVPASLIGIGAGTLLFSQMSTAIIRFLLGALAIAFTLHYWAVNWRGNADKPRHFGPAMGVAAAATSGFTSFIAHAGGPPLSMYLLRRGLDKTALCRDNHRFFCCRQLPEACALHLARPIRFSQSENVICTYPTRTDFNIAGRLLARACQRTVVFQYCLQQPVFCWRQTNVGWNIATVIAARKLPWDKGRVTKAMHLDIGKSSRKRHAGHVTNMQRNSSRSLCLTSARTCCRL